MNMVCCSALFLQVWPFYCDLPYALISSQRRIPVLSWRYSFGLHVHMDCHNARYNREMYDRINLCIRRWWPNYKAARWILLQNDLFGTPKDKKYFCMIHTLYQTCNTSYHGQKRCASAACRDTDHAAGATTTSIIDAQIEANNKLEGGGQL
jgi:hypothetical protein